MEDPHGRVGRRGKSRDEPWTHHAGGASEASHGHREQSGELAKSVDGGEARGGVGGGIAARAGGGIGRLRQNARECLGRKARSEESLASQVAEGMKRCIVARRSTFVSRL